LRRRRRHREPARIRATQARDVDVDDAEPFDSPLNTALLPAPLGTRFELDTPPIAPVSDHVAGTVPTKLPAASQATA